MEKPIIRKQLNNIQFTPITNHPRMDEIFTILDSLVAMKHSGHQIINVLQTFRYQYGWMREEEKRRGQRWSFKALSSQYGKILPEVCKQLALFILKYPPTIIPMITSNVSRCVDYNKKQIYYILVLMFFCLVPLQYSDKKQRGLSGQFSDMNNFAHIFTYSLFKTKCIMEYFKKQCKKMNNQNADNRILTIIRKVEQSSIEKILDRNKGLQMSKIRIEANNADIEHFIGQIKVDFANEYIGGGCLGDGCVQEEIMFAIRPQLLAATILCQRMQHNEALAFIGFPKFFKSLGYGRDVQFNGFQDTEYGYIKNSKKQLQVEDYIVGIDAIRFQKEDPTQFSKQNIDREIFKAYVGFTALPIKACIVTGNWGCGVFNGDHITKMIIQWIAATLAKRQLIYCPFGKKKIIEQSGLLFQLGGKQVGFVYDLLIEAGLMKIYKKYFRYDIQQLIIMVLSKTKE